MAGGLSTRPTTSTSVADPPVPIVSTSPTPTPVLLAALASATASPAPVGKRPATTVCHCRTGSREASATSADWASWTPSLLIASIA